MKFESLDKTKVYGLIGTIIVAAGVILKACGIW